MFQNVLLAAEVLEFHVFSTAVYQSTYCEFFHNEPIKFISEMNETL